MCVKLGHAKFQPFSARKILSYWGLNGEGGGVKMCSTENWPYLRNGERYGQGYY